MKKILGAFAVAVVLASCQKKVERPLQDSNVMLEEPAPAPMTDSTTTSATAKEAVATATAAKDSAAATSASTPANGIPAAPASGTGVSPVVAPAETK